MQMGAVNRHQKFAVVRPELISQTIPTSIYAASHAHRIGHIREGIAASKTRAVAENGRVDLADAPEPSNSVSRSVRQRAWRGTLYPHSVPRVQL